MDLYYSNFVNVITSASLITITNMMQDLNFSCLGASAYLNAKVNAAVHCFTALCCLEYFLLYCFTCSLLSDFLLEFFPHLFLKHLCMSFIIIEALRLLFQQENLLRHWQEMFQCFDVLLPMQLLGHSVEFDSRVEFHKQHEHLLTFHCG